MMLQSENFRRCIFTDTSEVTQCHKNELLYYINSEKILIDFRCMLLSIHLCLHLSLQVLETLKGDKNLEQFSLEYDSLLKAVRKSHGELAGSNQSLG